jgi:hypothetical protein
MAIQYINGARASDPIIKAIEAELDNLESALKQLDSIEDTIIVMHKVEALMKVYSQFTTPFEIMVIG